jgi:hypothetical protein
VAIRESLQTNAPSLGELLANGRVYRVPPFQRNYSWGEPEWKDLWEDLLEARKTGRDHYLGAIVLQRDPEAEDAFQVIDGQQRLATLSILILACVARLEALADAGQDADKNRERAEILRERHVSPRDAASLTRRSRLRLNAHDDPFFQSALVNGVGPENVRRLSRSERALWEAWSFFRDRIGERPWTSPDGPAEGEALARFVDTLTRRLVFIEIIVDDQEAAYTVFETLNARGVALGTADLLKNYLFARAAGGGGADLEEMQYRWDRLVATVPLESVADLAHHQANTEELNVSKRHVFRRVRNVVTDKRSAFEYVGKLAAAADWYAALLDPDDDLWTGFAGARKWVRVLVMLRAEQYRPLALAAAPRYQDRPDDLERLFRILAIYTLRANVILRLNTGDIYRAWNRAAVRVHRGEARTPTDVAREARSIYGEDEAFRAAFAELKIPARGPRKKLVRYLLAALEEDASDRHVDWETDPFTIEHVLPESGGPAWTVDEQTLARFADRLGNYLPLEASKNRDADQRPFREKLAIYETSSYSLPRQLEFPDWGPEAIRQQSERYAKRAEHIWRVQV